MGLGLAIVDRIAKLLDHEVSVHSHVGKGSCFAVALDAALAGEIPIRDQVALNTGHVKRKSVATIIVIENDLQILEGMIELLEARGYNAIPTVSAEEALESLETLNRLPNLILAD
jgi:two-component system, sensor histidine kinase